MSIIDPKLFATGVGAVTGGYFLSTDNDIMGIAVGAAIGGGTGMFMDYSVPDNLDKLVNKASGNSRKVIDKKNVKGRGRTFEQRKESLLKQAERRAKRNSKATDIFDSSKPFSTLNSGSLDDFKVFLDNLKSVESLDDLEHKFKYKTDEITSKASDITNNVEIKKLPSSKKVTIKAGASEAEKIAALRNYLQNLYGYGGDNNKLLLDEKVQKLSNMLNATDGMIHINDGVLTLTETNTKVNLSTVVRGSDNSIGSAFVSNGQVYYRPQVNLMGLAAMAEGDNPTKLKAVADALGIKLADAFNLQKSLEEVAGMAPDDAISLMYGKLKNNKELLDKFTTIMNDKKVHSTEASGKLSRALANGQKLEQALPVAENANLRIINQADSSTAINFDEHGNINTDKLIRQVRTTSENGIQVAESKKLVEHYGNLVKDNFSGSKADNLLELPLTRKRQVISKPSDPTKTIFTYVDNDTSKAFNMNTAHERGALTVGNRQVKYDDARSTETLKEIEKLIDTYSNGNQFATDNFMITEGIDGERTINLSTKDANGEHHTKAFTTFLGDIFGGRATVADGQGLMNRETAKNLTYSKNDILNVSTNSKGEFTIIDPIMKKYIDGDLSFDDFKKGAAIGGASFNNRFTGQLRKAKNTLEALQTINSDTTLSAKEKFEQIKKLSPNQFKNKTFDTYTGKKLSDDQIIELANRKVQRHLGRHITPSKAYSGHERLSSISDITEVRGRVNEVMDLFNGKNSTIASNLDVVNYLLAAGKESKDHKRYTDSFYPKAGHTYAINGDGSLVQAKQNATTISFAGAKSSTKEGNTRLHLDFDSKINVGDLNYIKLFGVAAKAQQQILEADDIAKIGMLNSANNIVVNEGKKNVSFNLRMSDGSDYRFNNVSYSDLSDLSLSNLFKKHISDKSGLNIENEIKHTKESFGRIEVLADADSSGIKAKTTLFDALKTYGTTGDSSDLDKLIPESNLFNKYLKGEMSVDVKDSNELIKRAHGLSNMYLASSTNKLSQDALMTTVTNYLVKGQKSIDKLLVGATDDDITKFKTNFGITADIGDHSSFNSAAARKALDDEIANIMKYFSEMKGARQNAWEYFTNHNGAMDSVRDLFVNTANQLEDHEQLRLYRAASPGMVARGESGSGTIEKNLSWNAAHNLKMSGYTDSQLGQFVNINAKLLADTHGVLVTTGEDVSHLGTFVNEQIKDSRQRNALLSALNEDGSKRRGLLANAGINIDTDKDIGIYKLQSGKNEQGIRHVPIMLESSKMFDSYTGSDGVERNKKWDRTIANIIQNDSALAEGNVPEYAAKKIREQLNTDLDYIKKEVESITTGSGNLAKKLLTTEAPASVYSLATAYDQSWIRDIKSSSGHSNIGIVSSEGLFKRLKEIGGDIGKHNSITSLVKAGLAEEIGEKGSGKYRLFMGADSKGNKVPLYALTTREPATGPGSTIMTELFVDTHLKGDKGEAFYTHVNDKIRQKFQLLDYDYDHQIEVYAKKVSANNIDELSEIHKHGQKMNQALDDMLEMVQNLGVKGKNKGEIGSFANLLDLSTIKNGDDYAKAISDDGLISKIKSSDRKSVSPIVTKIASQMSNTIMEGDGDDMIKLRSRMLTHYFVENLLKSQHIANETYSSNQLTTAEQLGHYLNNGRKSDFITGFAQYIEDNIIKNLAVSDDAQKTRIIQQIRESYKYINEQIEKSNTIGKEVITPMDLRAQKTMAETVENLSAVIHGVNAAVAPGPVLDQQIKAESEMTIVERGKMNYHRASEIVKHNISNNKKLLMGSGAAMIGAALLTQSKPDFGNKSAQSNPSGMLLDPHRESLKEQARQQGFMGDVHRATEYISPYSTNSRSNVHVDGEYMDYNGSGDLGADINHAVFGDGMSNFRVLLE